MDPDGFEPPTSGVSSRRSTTEPQVRGPDCATRGTIFLAGWQSGLAPSVRPQYTTFLQPKVVINIDVNIIWKIQILVLYSRINPYGTRRVGVDVHVSTVFTEREQSARPGNVRWRSLDAKGRRAVHVVAVTTTKTPCGWTLCSHPFDVKLAEGRSVKIESRVDGHSMLSTQASAPTSQVRFSISFIGIVMELSLH